MCYRWHCKKCQIGLHQQRGKPKEEELDVEAFAGGASWLQRAMHTRVEFPSVWGIRLSCWEVCFALVARKHMWQKTCLFETTSIQC